MFLSGSVTVLGGLQAVPLPVALLVLGLGVFVVLISVVGLTKFRASKTWLWTTGEITSAEMEKHVGHGRSRSVSYHAAIVYDYSVQGTKYSGHRVAFGEYGTGNPNHARQILNCYPLGKQVDVYYNPSKPEDSVLERRLGCAVYIGLLVGAAVFVLGLLLTIKCFQRQNGA
jgi:hypothetical protein